MRPTHALKIGQFCTRSSKLKKPQAIPAMADNAIKLHTSFLVKLSVTLIQILFMATEA